MARAGKPVEPRIDPRRCCESHAPELAHAEVGIHILRRRRPAAILRWRRTATTPAADRRRTGGAPSPSRGIRGRSAKRQFDLLTYRTLWFGDPIDWHLDPLRSRRAPLIAWSLIDVHDPAIAGDSRLIWELNRHQWPVSLAQAWTLTGNEDYAEAWHDDRRMAGCQLSGRGYQLGEQRRGGARAISWCWTLLLPIREARSVSAAWLQRMFVGLWLHAAHVRRYLSLLPVQKYRPDLRITGSLLRRTVVSEFREADRWREVAVRILASECDAQICRDGVHFERSTSAVTVTADAHPPAQQLRTPELVDQHSVQQMIDFLVAIRRPDGVLPALGDDGGCHAAAASLAV